MQMQSLLKKQMIYARGAIFKEIASAKCVVAFSQANLQPILRSSLLVANPPFLRKASQKPFLR